MNLLGKEVDTGIFRSDINFGVLSKMLEEISDMFTDYDFLLENRLTTREAIDEALKIIFNGILKEKSAESADGNDETSTSNQTGR